MSHFWGALQDYQESSKSYNDIVEYFFKHSKDLNYYKEIGSFLNRYGIKGPILWTEVVKCELSPNRNQLNENTIRRCVKKYLFKEIEIIPKNWLMIAVGKQAFDVLKYLCLERSILGIYHPNSRGYFQRMFVKTDHNDNKIFTSKIEKQINKFKKENGIAYWLQP